MTLKWPLENTLVAHHDGGAEDRPVPGAELVYGGGTTWAKVLKSTCRSCSLLADRGEVRPQETTLLPD